MVSLFVVLGGLSIPFDVARKSAKHLATEAKLRTFGNARAVDNFLSFLEKCARSRVNFMQEMFKT